MGCGGGGDQNWVSVTEVQYFVQRVWMDEWKPCLSPSVVTCKGIATSFTTYNFELRNSNLKFPYFLPETKLTVTV
jgi:hypothetical protein